MIGSAIHYVSSHLPVFIPTGLNLLAVGVTCRRRFVHMYEAFFLCTVNFYVWAMIDIAHRAVSHADHMNAIIFLAILLLQVGIYAFCSRLSQSVTGLLLSYGVGFFCWFMLFPVYDYFLSTGALEVMVP